eukprot:COSAG05_NODE_2093_length_3574_cov_5.267338_1_plen_252_part_00
MASSAGCLTQDDVEALLGAPNLSALDLAAASLVCTSWYLAYQRLKRIPQWVSAMSSATDTDAAVVEVCKTALAQIRCKPDVVFVFCTPSYDMARLSAGLRKALGDVQICGCTGAAVIGTEPGNSPLLVEDGDALSISLVYFAGQCEAVVRYAASKAAVPTLPQPDGGEQQLIVLGHPKSGDWVNFAINELCKCASKSVVFGGLASGRHGIRDIRLVHRGGVSDKGVLVSAMAARAQNFCRAALPPLPTDTG